MLNQYPVYTILPAQDMARAKNFYQNILGLELVPSPMEDPLMFNAGIGTSLVIMYRPERTKAEHTVASFMVKGLEPLMKELEAKGVKFENLGLPDFNEQRGLKTDNHIMDYGVVKSTWFRDTEGNILALNEMSS